MKKKLFNLVLIISTLALILLILSGCTSSKEKERLAEAEKKLDEEMRILDYISEVQGKVEIAIANMQMSFINENLSNPDAMICEHLTLEIFDEVLKDIDYKLCLENDKNKKPENMSELLVDNEEIYFTDGTHILKISFSVPLENAKYNIDSSDLEIVK